MDYGDKMNCQYVCNRLSAFIDGELSSEIALQIDQHLCECTSCSNWHSELLETLALTNSGNAAQTDIWSKVYSGIQKEPAYTDTGLKQEILALRKDIEHLRSEIRSLQAHLTPKNLSASRSDALLMFPNSSLGQEGGSQSACSSAIAAPERNRQWN